MERKGRIWSAVLIALTGCTAIEKETEDYSNVCISVCTEDMGTRALDPDETLMTDMTFWIFDEYGYLEDCRYFTENELISTQFPIYEIQLMKGVRYSFYVCTNTGMQQNISSFREMMNLKCHLAYPDEYREGIPMAGKVEDILIDEETSGISIPLERMMAKISLSMDRGGLSDDVSMTVTSVRIGNCPKSATLFAPNSVKEGEECFPVGFTRFERECRTLNTDTGDGISGSVSLYMLENMQGKFSEDGPASDSHKIFDNMDIRQETCSYIEVDLDYESSSLYSLDKPLTYRFYLGTDRNNLDVERNCHYHITIIPEDNGLTEDSWRVDKSGIREKNPETHFEMTPSGYIEGTVGDQIHVRCSFSPSYAPFDIGLEELEEDRHRGIYDYIIDEDGLGVTLTLKSTGTGIIYMSAGEPVNEAGMLVIEINNIKNLIL